MSPLCLWNVVSIQASDRLGCSSYRVVDNYFTRQYIPEDNSEHHTHRRENLKSHNIQFVDSKQAHITYQFMNIKLSTDDGQHGRNAFGLWPITEFKSSWFFLYFST
jgi:hypothetical protein